MRTLVISFLALLALAPLAGAAPVEHLMSLHEFEGGLHISPPVVHARSDTTLVFTVQNTGVSEHDLLVCADAPDFDQACAKPIGRTALLFANETGKVTFDAPGPGRYEYYCTVPGHKQGGMKGELVVQGDAQKKGLPGPSLALVGLATVALAIALRARRVRP